MQEFFIVDEFTDGINGVLGSDFFHKYFATIDYEKYEFSFWIGEKKISVPIQSQCNFYTKIPARCEIIKYFSVDINEDCVVLSEELSQGVLIASSLATPKNNIIPVKILNVRDEEVILRNFKPKVEKLKDFEICNFSDSKNYSVNRIDTLLDLINTDHLNKEECFSIQRIITKYSDVFYLEKDPLSTCNFYKQKIQLKKGENPVYVKPYRLPHAQKEEVHRQIDKMLQDGVIEEATSAWSAPLLIVPKKADSNGTKSWRVVIDYRLLNTKIEDDKFQLTNITEILDSLSGAMYFSHLDLSQGYYQIELDKESRPCTAFTTDRGQFQMTRLPMGLKISPNVFSRAMSIAMSGLSWESCFIYMDDLIVWGSNLLNHNINLTKVLQRLRDVNLKLNPKKCDFLKKEIMYLGHVISADGVLPDKGKIEAIQKYPEPKNANETKRFVAFVNYYRKFIKNFAQIAAPLNNLSKKNVTFNWTLECQNAFKTLKNALINPPILQYPNFSPSNIFTLKTDASGVAIGAVLSNANDKPVAYASRSLNKAERNYCTIEKELLAVVWAVKHFRPYLYGRKFIIFVDHKPLVYLFGMTNPSSRLTKFRLILEEYDFTIKYIKGTENVTADALSRIELTSDELKKLGNSVNDTLYAITRAQAINLKNNEGKEVTLDQVPNERIDHPGVVELIKVPQKSFKLCPISVNDFNALKQLNNYEYVKDNYLCCKNKQTIYMKQDTRSTLALRASLRALKSICVKYNIPELFIIKNDECAQFINNLLKSRDLIKNAELKISIIKNVKNITDVETRQIILNDFHMLPTGGHAGMNRMFNNIKKYFTWAGLKKDVETFVKKCDDCQRYKYSTNKKMPMSVTTTASGAFQKVFLDLVGPLQPDVEQNKYILTLQCELSKFVECYPLQNKESETVSRAFVNNFILRYGIPEEIVTDQGTEFLAEIFKDTCKLLRIKNLSSTAYHHETLGSLENTHKSLGNYLRIQTAKTQNSWSSWINFWCFSYNNTVHTETKYTPYELVFGKSAKLPSNVLESNEPIYNFDNYPIELKYRLQQAWDDAKNNLMTSKSKRKSKHDVNSSNIKYKLGDKVLLRNNAGHKMDAIYNGPYNVVEDKCPNIIIKIDDKLVEVHKNRVKLYH